MIVWVAELHYPYSSDELIGVYSTQDKAKEACQEHAQIKLDWLIVCVESSTRAYADEYGYNFFTVENYEVDK